MKKIVIIGNRGGTNVGGSLERAALEMGHSVEVVESRLAMSAPAPIRLINWHLRGHLPSRLQKFSREVLALCRRWHPDVLIATGIAPLNDGVLKTIADEGIRSINYLTDDPWNPAHRSPWFIRTLGLYETIFTVRRANIGDLKEAGAAKVVYLPFAFDPLLHHPYKASELSALPAWDVIFVGGADKDREPYIRALIQKNLKIGLYGSYWNNFASTRGFCQGQTDAETAGRATAVSRVAICLVRKANRDGNCMRTFEIPAIGACMLTEDTEEHREIFGEEGKNVLYFKTPEQMAEKAVFLVNNDEQRMRLAASAHALIFNKNHSYGHRLRSMLGEEKVR